MKSKFVAKTQFLLGEKNQDGKLQREKFRTDN